MSTTSESREDSTLDRVAAWSCAASAAVFVVVVALVILTEGADGSLKGYVTGEPALMPALFVFVSLALASAAVAHRPVWRRSMTVASAAVVALAVAPSAAPLLPEVVYYVLPPVALALVSTALPVQLARVVLLATAGVVCFVPLGYFILPVPISVAALGRSTTIARDLWRKSRAAPS